jgi:hypothetical protein
MNYTFNFEVVNVIPAKLPNIMFSEGNNSIENVSVEEFDMSMIQTIVKTEQELKDISLIGLIEKTYKFITKDIISRNPEQRFHNHMFLVEQTEKEYFLIQIQNLIYRYKKLDNS